MLSYVTLSHCENFLTTSIDCDVVLNIGQLDGSILHSKGSLETMTSKHRITMADYNPFVDMSSYERLATTTSA